MAFFFNCVLSVSCLAEMLILCLPCLRGPMASTNWRSVAGAGGCGSLSLPVPVVVPLPAQSLSSRRSGGDISSPVLSCSAGTCHEAGGIVFIVACLEKGGKNRVEEQ